MKSKLSRRHVYMCILVNVHIHISYIHPTTSSYMFHVLSYFWVNWLDRETHCPALGGDDLGGDALAMGKVLILPVLKLRPTRVALSSVVNDNATLWISFDTSGR